MKKFQNEFQSERLESLASIRQLFSFITRTYDGCYLIVLSALYIFSAILLVFGPYENYSSYAFALAMYPVLLFVIYVRQRIGTSAFEKRPMLFSFVSLSVIAIVPIYIIFWR